MFLIGVVSALSVIPAALAVPFMVIPSYVLNIKSYFRIMKYWWSGNRFQGEVEEKHIVAKPAYDRYQYQDSFIPHVPGLS